MKLYKLTDRKCQTKNQTQWGENVTHTTSGEGELCGPGWLHAYEHPLLAVLLNPIHAYFRDPVLWEAEGEGPVLRDGQLKLGVTRLTTVRQIPLPEVTTEQRVRFAILCAKQVCKDPAWNDWANGWLSGKDRSRAAAAAAAARAAKWAAAAEAAAAAAARAAEAARAARAAAAAAWAAAEAEWAAEAAEWAARAAEWAARAAEWASKSDPTLDLVEIALEAMKTAG